jgi:hypothetical protein
MRSFLLVLTLLSGCAGLPGRDAPPAPLVVTATDGTSATAPLFSWRDVGASEVTVYDADGRVVWGIVAGIRTFADGRGERVLIPSPVPYGAFASGGNAEAPTTTHAATRLTPGATYTVTVRHVGGGSGGFVGRRPIVRDGSATFTVR